MAKKKLILKRKPTIVFKRKSKTERQKESLEKKKNDKTPKFHRGIRKMFEESKFV